jgi:hypothetical protein
VRSRRPVEHVDQLKRPDLQSGFLARLAHRRLDWVFVRLDPAARQAPALVIAPPHEQNIARRVEDRRVGADFGCSVAQLAHQALADSRRWQVERFAIIPRGQLH